MEIEPEFKFIIPLVTDGLKKEYFTEEAGFVGAYTRILGEVDRGLYNPTLFLVFDYMLDKKEKFDRYYAFKRAEETRLGIKTYKNMYEDPKHVIIDKKHYLIYSFPLKGNAAMIERNGSSYSSLMDNDHRKILKFWGVDDEDAWKLTQNNLAYCGMKYPYKPLENTKKPKDQLVELNKLFNNKAKPYGS